MMITTETVEELANLAKLHFSENEKAELMHDLQRMIGFVEKLNELNTEGVEPLLHMSDGVNILRNDEVNGSAERDTALSNAPVTDGVFFKVPKVIKK